MPVMSSRKALQRAEELNLLHPVCHYRRTHPADSFSVLSCDRVAEFGLPYNPSTESEDGSHLRDGNHRGFDKLI